MRIQMIKTPVLRLAYEESGPKEAEPLILLHGWPDSPRTWDQVLPRLHEAGFRTVTPYLRGYGPSEFRDRLLRKRSRRTGQPVAFAYDIVCLADQLGLKRFHFVGHDWGARTGHALAAVYPERLKSLVTISVAFQPGRAVPPKLLQAQAYWYQWLLCSQPGEQMFRDNPIAFAKAQWDTWSPSGWYTSAEFDRAAVSWQGEDFKDVVLHSYRSRWGHAALDPAYQTLQSRYEATQTLATPTVLLHGANDHCVLEETTRGLERFYTGGYQRVLLHNVGHFPQREQPQQTSQVILSHIRAGGRSTGG